MIMLNFNRLVIVGVVGMLGLAASGVAHGNERGEAKATIGGATVAIDYGRPMLKGRDPMKLIPPGAVWRIGADAPTTIDSDADLDFGGTRVPKGKHILLAHYIAPGKWSLVVSSKPAAQYDPEAKLAEIPTQVQEGKDSVEEVAIQLSAKGGHGVIEIAWGTMRLVGSFSAAK
jgi:hypothetical protein